MAAEESKVKLKLYVDTDAEKVLFAEAGKDFIDFLIHLLSLPLGTVVKILKEKGMIGCLGELYQSIEKLNETYLLPNQTKSSLLNPSAIIDSTAIPLKLSDLQLNSQHTNPCFSTANPCSVRGGFVQSLVIFLVLDNFKFIAVTGSETLFTLLNTFKVSNFNILEKIVIELGVDEALELLKLSLECKTVLTSFYFGNKKAQGHLSSRLAALSL